MTSADQKIQLITKEAVAKMTTPERAGEVDQESEDGKDSG
jgi:hypothetical protein